ncbi:phage tail tape measure protein [Burkholderia multivorans]|uniref:phage tail tape measure protein n=1 Tax=Burkholderia multivorans TaxID=87883 RepID=UPI000D00D2CB|nr:phage tail tape measure protein [Burkholderia multivorans]PRF55317.1 phage tail tape measure protein [Burkholderia multivorans]
MAFEAYKIAVKLSLIDGVSGGLAALSSHFLASGKSAAQLEDRLKSIKRMMLAGGALTATGIFGLKVLQQPLEEAKKFQTEVAKFSLYGMGDAANAEAAKFAKSMNIIGSSYTENMRFINEAQGVFREAGLAGPAALEGAKLAAPVLAKIHFATSALDDESKAKMHTQSLDMLRFIEMRGGLQSAEAFNRIADMGWKAMRSSGGNVDWSQYRQFLARGGVAAQGLSDQSLFAELEPIIGEMKGSTAGFSLRTAFNRLNGIIRVPNQVAHELTKYGIWDDKKIVWNSQGGIKSFKGNPLVDQALFSSDPVKFYETKIKPMYDRMGIKDRNAVARENAMIFGSTGGAMFSLIDKQLATIHKSVDANNKALGIDKSVDAASKTLGGKEVDLHAKYRNLMETLGEHALPMAIRGLEWLIKTVDTLNGFLQKHPGAAKALVVGFTALSGMTLIAGEILLFGGAFRALSTAIAFTRVGSTMVRIARVSRLAFMALRPVGNGLVFLGGIVRGILGPFGLLARGLVVLGRALAMGAIGGIGGIFKLAGAIAGTASTALSGALAALVSPLGIVVLALGTLAAAAYAFSPISQKEVDSYKTDGGVKLTPSAAARLAAIDSGATTNGPNIGPRQQSVVQLQHQTLLDGRVIADSAAKYIVGSMNAPVGTGAVDTRQTMPTVSSPYPFR